MSCNVKINEKAKLAICNGVVRDDAIVEMEALGLSQKIINALEESRFRIMTLKDLMYRTQDELSTIDNIGSGAVFQIFQCLSRYHELEVVLS